MMYYKISHGSVTLGNNTVLEDINFCVKDNEKIGIVGRNGCGKTTLLKAITSEYEINSGYEEVDIISSGDFNIGYVKRNDGYNLDMKMIDYIKSAFKDILDIEKKLNTLENEMTTNYDEKILNKYNVDFKSQYKFNDCKSKRELPFDFYITNLNIVIEYDGIQHYRIIKYFNGLDGFITTKIHDVIKTKYCKDNNIKLIRIPYWEFDNIENILIKELNLK